MNNIEKIRQEIERRREICEGIFERESDTYYQGKAVAYGEALAFIDSLPEEKPSEDLEEEIQGMYQAIFGTDIINRREMVYLETFDMIARHFAEWQKAKDDEETADLLTIVALDAGQRAREELVKLELTWQDIRRIVKIADDLLDDPEARVEYNNHNEEYYYKKVLEEYRKPRCFTNGD